MICGQHVFKITCTSIIFFKFGRASYVENMPRFKNNTVKVDNLMN